MTKLFIFVNILNMKNFYIFLDFDGTMNDIEHLIKLSKLGVARITKVFKPESISALNFLIENLSKNYDVNIVITSSWRVNMPEAISRMKDNSIKLDLVKNIDKTDFVCDQYDRSLRDKEIKKFLREHYESENYVVIDDEAGRFNLPVTNIIETNLNNAALNMTMVKHWLENFKKLTEELER